MTEEQNRLLTRVGPGTPMGGLLRRYWMPIAGVSEFDSRSTKPLRLMGEDLVLYRDLSGTFGLIDRHCPHRRADLAHGMVESCGLRCNYHGWRFDERGACAEQPFEDAAFAQRNSKARISTTAYPVALKAGLVWAYLGPQPAPLLPDWEAFSRENGFVQIALAEVPCNWLQCQENSPDPLHLEWLHDNWGRRLREGAQASRSPRHLKLAFEEFELGFIHRRVREDSDESHPLWSEGRVTLWPNAAFLGDLFQWIVPIDDENTLDVTWRFSHLPKGHAPYIQGSIPAWVRPVKDEQGKWVDAFVKNQDYVAWCGQGRIADRTGEHLGESDRGITMMRHRFIEELKIIAAGGEPKGLFRDPKANVRVRLPYDDTESFARDTAAEILADPRKRARVAACITQYGQPEDVKRRFLEAMGLDATDLVQEFTARTHTRIL